jgi:uncharacterized protein YegP (UPF0339 family)
MRIHIFSRLSFRTFRTQWYFRVVAANGKTVAQSEGYKNKTDVYHIIVALKSDLKNAEIVELK